MKTRFRLNKARSAFAPALVRRHRSNRKAPNSNTRHVRVCDIAPFIDFAQKPGGPQNLTRTAGFRWTPQSVRQLACIQRRSGILGALFGAQRDLRTHPIPGLKHFYANMLNDFEPKLRFEIFGNGKAPEH